MDPLLKGILLGASPSTILLMLVVYFIIFPLQFQKLVSVIAWFLSFVWKRFEYVAIKTEIQGKVNSFVGLLEKNSTLEFPRVSVRWAAKDDQEMVFEDGEVIIVMKDRSHKMKNFVHAAYFFTSEMMLRKTKRHLSKTQKISLDLFATKKLLEEESAAAVEQFMTDYFVPQVDKNEGTRELIGSFIQIDQKGIFFPVLIQELFFLGHKIFMKKATAEFIKEIKNLINFLDEYSQREAGSHTPEVFIGKYMRCAIRVVASQKAREKGDIKPHRDAVIGLIKQGLENIYMIGRYDDGNVNYIHKVVSSVLEERKDIQLIRSYNVKGKIIVNGKTIRLTSHLVHLHNPDAVRYLYQESDFDALSV